MRDIIERQELQNIPLSKMIIHEGYYRQTQENNHGVFLRRRNDNRTQFRDIFRKGGWMQSSLGNGLNDGSQSQNQSNQPSDIDSQDDMPLLFGFEEGLDYLTETNSDKNSPKHEQIAQENGNISNSLNGDFTQDLQMNHKSKKIFQIHLNKRLLERKKEFSLRIKTKEMQLDNDIKQAELQGQKDTIRQIFSEKGQIQVETYGKGFTILSKMGYKLGQGLGKFQQGRKEPIEVNLAKTTLDMQEDYEAIKIQNKLLLWDQFKIIVEEDEEEQQGEKSLARQKDIKHEEKICKNEGTISKQRHKQIVEPMEFNVVCHGVSQDLKSIQKQMKIQLEKISLLLERSKIRQTHLKEELVSLKRNTQPISEREDYCRLFIDQLNEVKNTEDCQEILKNFEGMFILSRIQFVKFGLEELLLEVIGVCLKRQNSIFLSENDATSTTTTTTTKDQIIELVNLVKGVQKIIVLAGNIKAEQLNQQLNQNKQKVFQPLDEIISRGQIYISEEVKLRTQQLSNCIKCQLKIFIKECLDNIQIYNLEMIICIEECKSIMSKQQIQEILSDGVFSSLFIFMKNKINTWNPTVNSLRQDDPDQWLLPWIELFEESQYLPELLDSCVEIIINKFKSALSKWQLTDETMIHRITPWKTIIGQKTWDRWITRLLIPKLNYFLEQSFEIDPWEQQQLETITHILQWCQVISSEDVQILLSDTLFAKIAEFLVEWVNTEGANLSDILDWIQEWEDIIGPHLMQIPSFQATFNSFRQKCQR